MELHVWYADADGYFSGELDAYGEKLDSFETLSMNAAKNGQRAISKGLNPAMTRPPDRPASRAAFGGAAHAFSADISPQGDRVPHNLLIHLDSTDLALYIHYSYPFSGPHHLPPQAISMPGPDIPADIRREIDFLRGELLLRVPPLQPVRLPHAELKPEIEPGVMTIVIQDATRQLPIARLYVYETVPVLGTRREVELRLDPGDWTKHQLASWRRLEQRIGAVVWPHYLRRIGQTRTG